MKKLYLTGLVIFCLFMSLGLKVYFRNNVTVQWDPPVYTGDGVMSFNVYLQDTDTGLFTLLGNTTDVEYTLDVPTGPEQKVGVQTKIVDAEGEHVSIIFMSDDVNNSPPFGLLQAVPAVTNVRIK